MKSRRPVIAGNWKMNGDRASGIALAKATAEAAASNSNVEVLVAPVYCYLSSIADALRGSKVKVAAQNMHFEDSGAFTGEVAPAMLKDVGCEYVILGHSERRHVFGERDEGINKKTLAALKHGLRPILCVGEKLDERESGKTNVVCEHQLRQGLTAVPFEELRRVVIAYEPVWAIGTGKVATPEQAQEVHAYLRSVLQKMYGTDLAQSLCVQYGGSVKSDNAEGLLAKPDIDGLLVGGASLKADDFAKIIAAAGKLAGK